MGFGTSGSLLVIFAGLVIGMGTLYTASANTAERVGDAVGERTDHQVAVQSTAIEVVEATWNTTTGTLTVTLDNRGETTLSVAATDAVVDGRYVPSEAFERASVDGADTGVWAPGERLVLEDADTVAGSPDRVKVVTETGVAATAPVVVVS
jgi:archaellum component FlaF (FlaF/FlaG flagellin family)